MPDIYSVNGVAAPEDTAEDYAAWLRLLAPGWLEGLRGTAGVAVPIVPEG